jgi:ATP10 protein
LGGEGVRLMESMLHGKAPGERVRRTIRILSAGWFALALALPAGGQAAARIPNFEGTTFAGETVSLPQRLKGGVGVLVLGFSRNSKTQTSEWGRRLAHEEHPPAARIVFEMPVLESVPKLLRGMVLKQIKSSIPMADQTRFLPVLDHEAEWKKAAGFDKPDDAYVLVVDGEGVVRWSVEGSLTDAALAKLEARMKEVAASP